MACYLVNTNPKTHELITANLDRAPMFNGSIEGVGPRYCPSIEDKVVRFAHKDSHGLFLEPEGWETNEVYLQGANTSLPEDVQEAFVRSIAGLERAEILKHGYAIEYDFVLGRPDQRHDGDKAGAQPVSGGGRCAGHRGTRRRRVKGLWRG